MPQQLVRCPGVVRFCFFRHVFRQRFAVLSSRSPHRLRGGVAGLLRSPSTILDFKEGRAGIASGSEKGGGLEAPDRGTKVTPSRHP